MIGAINELEDERSHILRGGGTGIGKCAIDVVKDIEARGHGHSLHQGPQGGIPSRNQKQFDAGETSVFRRLPLYTESKESKNGSD